MAIMRFNRKGKIIWKKCYSKGTHAICNIVQYNDSLIACLGHTNQYPNDSDPYLNFWILILDKNGNEIKEYSVGKSRIQDRIYIAKTTPDGGFIAGGDITVLRPDIKGDVELDMQLIKVSAEGEIEWSFQKNKAYWDHIKSILLLKDGSYILGGHCSYKTDNPNKKKGTVWVFKIDENGKEIWEHNYGNGEYDFIAGMLEKDNEEIVFIGRETSQKNTIAANCGRRGFWIAGLSHDGKLLWENFIINKSTGGRTYAPNETLFNTKKEDFIVAGSDLTDIRTSCIWLAIFDEKGKIIHEKIIKDKACRGVAFIVPFEDKFVAAGWKQGYNTMSGVFESRVMDFRQIIIKL